jgi:hypothetical protein
MRAGIRCHSSHSYAPEIVFMEVEKLEARGDREGFQSTGVSPRVSREIDPFMETEQFIG